VAHGSPEIRTSLCHPVPSPQRSPGSVNARSQNTERERERKRRGEGKRERENAGTAILAVGFYSVLALIGRDGIKRLAKIADLPIAID
jgi:hypothetical protein